MLINSYPVYIGYIGVPALDERLERDGYLSLEDQVPIEVGEKGVLLDCGLTQPVLRLH
jgi:hypothetical protein